MKIINTKIGKFEFEEISFFKFVIRKLFYR